MSWFSETKVDRRIRMTRENRERAAKQRLAQLKRKVAEHREVCRKFEQERRRKIENMKGRTEQRRTAVEQRTGKQEKQVSSRDYPSYIPLQNLL